MSTQIVQLKRSLSSRLIEILISAFRKKARQKGTDDLVNLIENRYKNELEPVIINSSKFINTITESTYSSMQLFTINDKKSESQKNIFYIHGGGWTLQPLSLHWKFLDKLAEKLDAKIIVPIYPKTPNSYKVAYNKLINLYTKILEDTTPNKLTIMGDSCGGNITLGLIQLIKQYNLPQPSNAIILSPCTDMNFDTPEMYAAEKQDPLLIVKRALIPVKYYQGNTPLDNPILSPIYGDFRNTTKITSFIGTHDILYPSTVKFDELLNSQNVDITTYVYPNMNHIFMVYPIPEAKDVINKITDIVGIKIK